ncbi:class I SAM-dependent methyltransferase [Geminicoccus flavidas]|uniref:class I SAM-dependent methyltransferase n=1 Tax=Geminicoccus flavidas TaxID=2506407 RepID=UPI00190F6E62|nr:class I SAM-dependent methyltransferase [Geminicoccus flavidas]
MAAQFLTWLAAPADLDWLDVGCGTGALAGAVAQTCRPCRLAGIDPSVGFLDQARRQPDLARAELQPGDARALPFPDRTFDRVVSGLALNFVPDPVLAVHEMARVARPGGEVALYVWDYAKVELMAHFWAVAESLDPDGQDLDEATRFPLCRESALAQLFAEENSLAPSATRAIEIATPFRDFDDYWSPFLGGQGIAPAYCMSLPEEQRAELCRQVRHRLPIAADGRIELHARAWAIRATRQ